MEEMWVGYINYDYPMKVSIAAMCGNKRRKENYNAPRIFEFV